MRTIYFDCTGGVSGDMVLFWRELSGHTHTHGRSCNEVKNIMIRHGNMHIEYTEYLLKPKPKFTGRP